MSKIEQLVNTINDQFGRQVAWVASDKDVDYKVPSGLPTLDHALAGGVPRGIPVILNGLKGTGKSSLCYRLAGQAAEKTGLPAVVIHSEGPFEISQGWAFKCGLPEENVVVRTGSLEEAINLIYALAKEAVASCIIVDSLASLKPEAVLKAAAGESKSYGGKAVMLNEFFNKIVNKCAQPYPLLLFTQHLYQSPLPHGGTMWKMSGGMDQEYMSGLILRLTQSGTAERTLTMVGGKVEDVTCLEVSWRIEKTKVGGKYHDTGGYRLYLTDDVFPAGTFSDAIQAVEMGIATGVINKAGSWFTYREQKYQGIDALLPHVNVEECVQSYADEFRRQRQALRRPIGQESEDDLPEGEGEESSPKRRGRRKGGC